MSRRSRRAALGPAKRIGRPTGRFRMPRRTRVKIIASGAARLLVAVAWLVALVWYAFRSK